MTTIRLLHNTEGQIRGYDVSGHAGAGTEGNDLVCAAISFLATTCANALETVAAVKPQVRQAGGKLTVTIPEKELTHEALVILDTFRQGAKDLADAYPKNVRLFDQAQ